jgi:hypothetical protein
MPFQKGRSKTGGKVKGSENKVKKTFKEAVSHLLESKQDEFLEWLALMDNPKDRFDILIRIAEYAHPKYSRTEHTGKDGNPIETLEVDAKKRRELLKQLLNDNTRTTDKT